MGACGSKEDRPAEKFTSVAQPSPAANSEKQSADTVSEAKPAAAGKNSVKKEVRMVEPSPKDDASSKSKEKDASTKSENQNASKPQQEKPKAMTQAPASFKVDKRDVSERYTVGKELGRGCFGVVSVCVEKSTGREWALKLIQKASLKNHSILQDEVQQLKMVGQHPNVVQLHDFFEDFKGNFYIVMELCRGGDLFTRIVNQGSYSEQMASQLLRQLASAIQHMHDNKIAHRDLKPENILLMDKSPGAPLKVVDFGLSKFVNSPQGMMNTVIGTWAYCAPEVFSRRPYNDAVDNWALGVLMFIMLSGYHPFDLYGDSSEAQLIDNICRGKFGFDEPEWQDVSEEAKALITALLQRDPSKRMSIEAFLKSNWIVGQTASDSALDRSQKRLQVNISSVFNLPPAAAANAKAEGADEELEKGSAYA